MDVKIAFLGYAEYDDGTSYRGAVLIADEWGKPLEFRCTAPVKPNTLQRTLYGSTLMPHVLVELIGKPLIDSLSQVPSVILADEAVFLDLRTKVQVPVLRIRRQGTKVQVQSDRTDMEKLSEAIQSSSELAFDPVIVERHHEFPDDLRNSSEILRDLFSRWDIFEPFERIEKGLEFVQKEKILAQ